MYSLQNSAYIHAELLEKIHHSFPLIHTDYELVDIENQELASKLELSIQEVELLKSNLIRNHVDEGIPLSTFIAEENSISILSTGDSTLDQFLGESFLKQSLSILSGPPGCGKTQLLLSIMCWCLRHNKQVLYISCGCDFVLERVLCLLQSDATNVLHNLFIEDVQTHQALYSCLQDYESVFQDGMVGCVLIDSLTFLLQPLLSLDIPNGRSLISHILQFLRQISTRYHLPIYMTNQTRTTLDKQTKNALNPNINYFMDNKVDFIQKEDGYVLYVDKSPYLMTPRCLPFRITEKGFCSCSIVCGSRIFL